MNASTDGPETPKTLNENLSVPETRMGDARQVQDRIRILIEGDRSDRSVKRARLKGLIDGNPPYRQSDLVAAGTPQRCNVNWRTAESYLTNARGMTYDVFAEVPTYAVVRTKYGDPNDRAKWSKIITEEFDILLKKDRCFDYHAQISQNEMWLYGCGPLMFEDSHDWRFVSLLHRNLLVPDMAPSDANQWDECAIMVDYLPYKLYEFIRNEDAARQAGWNPTAVKEAIRMACPRTLEGGTHATWEWHQDELKTNSFQYSARSKVIQCAHYFVREFAKDGEDEGKVSHSIVLIAYGDEAQNNKEGFLFQKVGRFDNWTQIIHPMYVDNDGGGYHHSVTGLGLKMYSPMETQNRLLCNAVDKANSPKLLFKPTTAQASEQMSITHLGDYGKVPRDWEAVQMPTGSFMDEVLVLNREISGMCAANLAPFRQNLSKDTGNPITAREAGLRAGEQSRLSRTQLNHFFNQLDWLYEEQYRRAVNADRNLPGGKEAKYFIKCCTDRGVPMEALKEYESVRATRVIGQGSPFLRQEIASELLATSSLNPSAAGREAILEDYYSAKAGVAIASRYVPKVGPKPEESDQMAIAVLQVAAAKDGVAPVVSTSQNNAIFASVFLKSADDALGSLEKGANPMEVYQFIETLMPAARMHIESMGQDPRLQATAKQLMAQWTKIASFHDKLGKQIQQQQQQMAEQAQMRARAARMQQGGDPELQLKAAETQGKLRIQAEKQRGAMALKAQKQQQDMALADARTAAEITNQTAKTQADIRNQERKAEAATVEE